MDDLFATLFGKTPALCLIAGAIFIYGLSLLMGNTPQTRKYEDDPDLALGKTVRRLYKLLNKPKDED